MPETQLKPSATPLCISFKNSTGFAKSLGIIKINFPEENKSVKNVSTKLASRVFGAVDRAADMFLTCWYVVAYKSKEPTKNLHFLF